MPFVATPTTDEFWLQFPLKLPGPLLKGEATVWCHSCCWGIWDPRVTTPRNRDHRSPGHNHMSQSGGRTGPGSSLHVPQPSHNPNSHPSLTCLFSTLDPAPQLPPRDAMTTVAMTSLVGNTTGPDYETLRVLQSRALSVALPAVYAVATTVGVPGNLFSLWVLCRHIGPRSPSIIFMINLSVTDALLGAILPFQIHYHCNQNHWVFGAGLCGAVTVGLYANMYVGALSVTCLGVDRFLGVSRPLTSSRWRRRRYALCACAASWTLVLAALSPLASADLTYDVSALGVVTCFDVLRWNMFPGGWTTWAAFLLGSFALLFLVPFAITVACYTATIRVLLRDPGQEVGVGGAGSDGPTTSGDAGSTGGGVCLGVGGTISGTGSGTSGPRARRRAARLAAVVLATFITCFAPSHVTLLVHVVGRLFLGHGCYAAYKVALGLSCLSSCLDPVVYCFASREFQERVRQYLPQKARPLASGHACGQSGHAHRGWERVLSNTTLSVRSAEGVDGIEDEVPMNRRGSVL